MLLITFALCLLAYALVRVVICGVRGVLRARRTVDHPKDWLANWEHDRGIGREGDR